MAEQTPIYNEKDLLLQVAHGETAAFRVLFDQYKNKVYSYAMHYTHREEMAEEIVQEAFLKVWLHRETLPFIERFEAWLFIISRNLSFNYLRKLSREVAFYSTFKGQKEAVSEGADEALLYKEQASLLKVAVNRLPPQQKLIYTLNKEQHLKPEAIARELGLAHSTVKSHLALAMRSIRTFMQASIDPVIILVLLLVPF